MKAQKFRVVRNLYFLPIALVRQLSKFIMIGFGYALIYGFGYGSLAPVMPYMISDRFGREAMGAAYGVLVFFATGLGGSVGLFLGGYIYDTTGSFDLGWQICMVALVIVAVAILVLKPNDRRVRT